MLILSLFSIFTNYLYSKNAIVISGVALVFSRSMSFLINQFNLGTLTNFEFIFFSLFYFIGEATLITGILLLLWKILPKLRVVISFFACLIIPLLILVGLIDIFLYAITGDHLTPSLLRQFSGIKIFTSTHFIEPVKSNAFAISTVLIFVLLTFVGFVKLFLHSGRLPHNTPVSIHTVLQWNIIGAIILSIPLAKGSYDKIDRPIEIIYFEELVGKDGISLNAEEESIKSLRRFVGLPTGRQWLDDQFPLIHGEKQTSPPKNSIKPDIFVIVIESLRAQCLDYILKNNDGCITPNLSALAKKSVIFPQYISNGFPSGPGFITMSASTWPHHKKRIIPDFKNITFDALALRLNSINYETIVVDGDANFDMQSFWNRKFFKHMIDLKSMGLGKSEKSIFREAKKIVKKIDAQHKPIYMQIKTSNPHLPYQTPNDINGELLSGDSLPENYIRSLTYVDKQIGKFIDFLKSRNQMKNTVIVITGDHANYLNQSKISSLPLNDTVWTSALIYGPENMIGKPRRIEQAASHIDLNPTLLAMAGDKRPMASFGRNLLANDKQKKNISIAIRPGGLRFDQEGRSYIIDNKQPNIIKIQPAFPNVTPQTDTPLDQDYVKTLLQENNRVYSYLLEQNRLWSHEFLFNQSP